jgi:hypothetical protein
MIYENNGVYVQGHVLARDPETREIYVNKWNAIHYENMSIALAGSIGGLTNGPIAEMSFGNGGTSIDPTGVITYLTPNSTGANAGLYNETYLKLVDGNNAQNLDPTRNNMEVRHVSGANYTDIVVTCLLDYGEPDGQDAFDTATDTESSFVFDELGLRSYGDTGSGSGRLLTHIIFHPVQKSLNRLLEIIYTVRIQSLSGGNS